MKELRNQGYVYKDIHDLFKQDKLPEPVVRTILKWFPEVYQDHRGTGDHLVRALISADKPFNPQPLIVFFEQNIYNSSVMWGVAHVLATAKTMDISVWLKNQLQKEHITFQRSGLVAGLLVKGGFKDIQALKNFLKKIFDKYPLEVLELFKKIGSVEDIGFLEEKLKPIERTESRDINKVITYLNKKSK